MTFDEILEQVIALLKSQGRVSYGALRRRYDLDEAYLKDLTDEIIKAQCLATDEDGTVMVWIGETATSEPPSQIDQTTPTDTQDDQPTLGETKPAETYTPDAAERRQLTVMFCDLVESTALSGRLDPEDLRDIVKAYQATCTEVIHRYDGHVAQLLGDGLLIYFGYPQAHEDDAQRAVRSGLEIVNALGTLNTRLEQDKGVKLAVRLGIHTGLVVVGEMGGEGRQEQLALGEVPNIASRIQGLAEPDTLIVSEATYRLVEGFFACDSLGEHDLKGVSESVLVYRVLNPSEAQQGAFPSFRSAYEKCDMLALNTK